MALPALPILLASAALAAAPSPGGPSPGPSGGRAAPPDAPGIDLHAWAQGGWLATAGPESTGVEQRPTLSLARISSRTDHTLSRYRAAEHVGSFLQLEAKEGTAVLLDARVELDLRGWIHLRAGRFKTAVSNEFLVPGTRLLTTGRPHYIDATPKRKTGVEVDLRPALDDGHLNVQIGAFAADDPWDPGEHTADDTLLTARLRHIGASHVLLHIGYLERLGLSGAERREGAQVQRELDVAAGLERDDLQVMVEGLAGDRGAGLEEPVLGGGVILARRFGELQGERVALEPTLSADVLLDEGAAELCEHVGLSVFWDGWNLVQLSQLSLSQTEAGSGWTASTQLRGGF